jgi:hypothetical protein
MFHVVLLIVAACGEIVGTVTDASTGMPIVATVRFPDNPKMATMTTDTDGIFVTKKVPAGTVTVAVSAEGYNEQAVTLAVEKGKAVCHAFELRADLSATYVGPVLRAVNAVEVPCFAYPSRDFRTPQSANLSIAVDAATGDTVLTVRLRRDSLSLFRSIVGIVNGGFLGGFDYVSSRETGWRPAAGYWHGTESGKLLWDTTLAYNRYAHLADALTRVSFVPSRMVIEAYDVQDSVLAWSILGAERVHDAALQAGRVGFKSSDIEFDWLLQTALPFLQAGDANRKTIHDLLAAGPQGFGICLRVTEPQKVNALAQLRIPELSARPKGVRLAEKWTITRGQMASLRIDKGGEWTESQVRSAAKIEVLGATNGPR